MCLVTPRQFQVITRYLFIQERFSRAVSACDNSRIQPLTIRVCSASRLAYVINTVVSKIGWFYVKSSVFYCEKSHELDLSRNYGFAVRPSVVHNINIENQTSKLSNIILVMQQFVITYVKHVWSRIEVIFWRLCLKVR